MAEDTLFLMVGMVMTALIAGGVVIIVTAMRQRGRELEMKHRERLAMIERGTVPAPAREPAEFDRWQYEHVRPAPARGTRMGIMIIALGFGFMFIVGFAGGAGSAAIGVGGAIAIIGVAFIINGELQRRSQPTPPMPPYRPPDPRGPVGP